MRSLEVEKRLVSVAEGYVASKTCGRGLIPAITGSIIALLDFFAARVDGP